MSVRTIQLILEARDRGASRNIQDVRGELSGVGRELKSVGSTAVRVAGVLGAAFGAREIAQFFLETNRQFERFLAQLETVEGSAAQAQASFRAIEDFASRTPFQIEELVESYVTLRTLGIQPTDEMLTSFGNTASAFGRRITEMSEAVRGAVTGEFEQLKRFGITFRVEGDHLVSQFRGQRFEVERNAEAIVGFLQDIGEHEFAGAMEREMRTLNGAISNLMDNLATLARTIGEAGVTGEITDLVGGVRDLTGKIVENKREVAGWVRVFIEGVQFIARSMQSLVTIAFNTGQMIGRAFDIAGSLVAGGVLAGFELIRIDAADLLNFLQKLIDPLELLGDAAQAVGITDRDWEGLIPNIEVPEGAITAADMFANAQEQSRALIRDFGQLVGATDVWAQSLADVVVAWEMVGTRALLTISSLGGGGGAGGGGGGEGGGEREGGGPGTLPDMAGPGFMGLGGLVPIDTKATDLWVQNYVAGLETAKEATQEFAATVTDAVRFGLVDTFMALGTAMGEALSGAEGAFRGLLGSVLGVLGDIMISAGTTIVLTSTAFEAFKQSLMSLVPGGGIAAGLLLIAAGAAMKAAVGSFLSSPTGGGGGGGGGGGLGQFHSLRESRGGGKMTVVIEGGDFINLADPRQRLSFKEALGELAGTREIEFVSG